MRLRIVEAECNHPTTPTLPWREVLTLRAPVRLGHEVFLTKTLTPHAISSAMAALQQFREAMDTQKVDHLRAVATSAMREANNAHVLIERASQETGIPIEVISGIEEARLVQLAVRRRLTPEQTSALMIDIGGGSTELTLLERGRPKISKSLPLGTVRLLEVCGNTQVDTRHAESVKEYVARTLASSDPELFPCRPELLIATGGTPESLLQLCPGSSANFASVPAISRLTKELSTLSLEGRRQRYKLRADRADTIVPATQILLYLAERTQHETIFVPGVGLKEGVLEDLIDKRFARSSGSIEELLGPQEIGIVHLAVRSHEEERTMGPEHMMNICEGGDQRSTYLSV